jgi:ferritin-like metal-binding protein YciE
MSPPPTHANLKREFSPIVFTAFTPVVPFRNASRFLAQTLTWKNIMPKQTRQNNRITSRGNIQSEAGGMDNELHQLFLDELADIYNAEQQLTKALPKLARAAQSDELREAFESHLEETEEHVSRLEQVAASLDETLKNKTCKAMKGLIAEGDDIIKEQKNSSALDAGLIAAAQKVEHYEIATYGTLCAWAEQMGHDEAFKLLKETEEEEAAADEKLTNVALNIGNQRSQVE